MIPGSRRRSGELLKEEKDKFKKYGRDSKWYQLKKKTDQLIEEAKREFYEKGKSKAFEKRDTGAYYGLVHKLKDGEAPKAFDVRSLRPELSAYEIANEIAEFFNIITRGYPPLEQRPTRARANVKLLQSYEVAARLRKFKKPKSMVRGDIYPDLISSLSDILAIPLTDIYNESRMCQEWPENGNKKLWL